MEQRFVIDASVVVQGFIEDSESLRVISLLKNLADPITLKLHIPDFCLVECTNIFWKRISFHGKPFVDAQEALNRLMTTPLYIHESTKFLSRALTIGRDYKLAVYDSVYLALCERLQLPLITADIRQAQAAEKLNILLKSLSDFPEFEPE